MKYWNSLLLCALLLLTGCLSDGDIVPDDSNKLILELTLSSSSNPPGETRALTAAQEDNIHDIKLLAFNANDTLLAGPISTNWLTLSNQNNNITKVKIALPYDNYMSKTVKFMLLGNMEYTQSSPNATLPAMTVGKTSYKDVLNALKYTVSTNWPTDNTRHFPMYGTITTTLDQRQNFGNVWMLRALARVQFYVNQGQGLTVNEGGNDVNLFDMQSVHVFYPRTEGYFCPDSDYVNGDTIYKIHTLNTFGQLKDTPARLDYTLATDGSEKWKYERSIYTPEAVNTSSSQQKVILVVGGKYKGDSNTTYYKAEFEDDETHAAFDILRNYTYDFNIIGVGGPGKDTPEEALVDGVQLTLKVRAWSEVKVAMADVSPYKLEVSESLLAYSNKTQKDTVDVETTYRDGWELVPNSIVGNWYTVTADTDNGRLFLDIEPNGNIAGRSGSFKIRAGEIIKQINVTQTPLLTSNCYIQNEPGLKGLQADVMGNGTYGTVINGTNIVSSSLQGATAPGTSEKIYNTDGTINKNAVKGARIIWQSRPGLITQVGAENPGDPVLTSDGVLKYTVGEPVNRSDISSGDPKNLGYMLDEDGNELGGNAVIGIFTKDGTGNDWGDCIWSWHIWVVWDWEMEATDQHFLTKGVKSGFFMQDRNLGAMRNQRKDPWSFGLLYEWGRKDPMRSTSSFATPYVFSPTYDYENNLNSTQWHAWSGGTGFTDILTSARNPMNFSDSWGANESAGVALWGNPTGNTKIGGTATTTDASAAAYNGTEEWNEGKKSIYDPCPLGYRVPSVNGFYFGKSGMAMIVNDVKNKKLYPYSYCDLDDVGVNSDGYIIYYCGQYTNYEKYSTWMPMTPFYEGTHTALTSPKAGSEGFAYTWLNCPSGKGGAGTGMVVGWHPINDHIHEYGSFGTTNNNGGTIRCVRETDPDLVPATLPDKVVLLADEGSSMDFEVLTNHGWKIEVNNLTYDWVKATKVGTDGVKVESLSANLTGQPREAIIYIVLDSGEKYPVKVIQESVSVGGSTLTVGCNVDNSVDKSFSIPEGGTLTLPGGGLTATSSDGRFSYTLSASTGTVKLTVKALLPNTTPDDIPAELHMNLSDGTNNNDLMVNIVQQKYTISSEPLILPYTSGQSKPVTFTPPTGSVVSLPGGTVTGSATVLSNSYPIYTLNDPDSWFSYTLKAVEIDLGKGNKVVGYTLTATTKQINYGLDHTEIQYVAIGDGVNAPSNFPVTVTQESKASIATCTYNNGKVGAIMDEVVGETGADNKSFMYIKSADGYYYEIEAAPEWVTFLDASNNDVSTGMHLITSDNSVRFKAKTAKSYLTADASSRTGTVEIKLYYYNTSENKYEDVKTFEFDITQSSNKIEFTAGTLSGSKGGGWTTNMTMKTNDNTSKYYYEIVSGPDWADFSVSPDYTSPTEFAANKNAVQIAANAKASKTSLGTRDGILQVMVYHGTETDGSLFDVAISQAASTISITGGTLSANKDQSGTTITFTNANGLSYEVLSKPDWVSFASSTGDITSNSSVNLNGTTTQFNVGTQRSGTVQIKMKDTATGEVLGTKDVTIYQSGLGMTLTGGTLNKKSGEKSDEALKISKVKNTGPYYYKIVTYPSWVSFTSLTGTLAYANQDVKIAGTTTESNSTGVQRKEPIEVEIYYDSSFTNLMGTLTGTITQNK